MSEFIDMMIKFLEEMCTIFDDCQVMQEKTNSLKGFQGNSTVSSMIESQWRKQMNEDSLKMLEDKNPELFKLFDSHKMLQGINFYEKWESEKSDPEFQYAIWWYVRKLTDIADPSYAKIRLAKKKTNKKKVKKSTQKVEKQIPEELQGAVAAASRLQEKLGIEVDEATGEIKLNFKKIMASNPMTDPDMKEVMKASAALLPGMASVVPKQ
jgi:hypothetical protein